MHGCRPAACDVASLCRNAGPGSHTFQPSLCPSPPGQLGSKGYGDPVTFDNTYFKTLLDRPWERVSKDEAEHIGASELDSLQLCIVGGVGGAGSTGGCPQRCPSSSQPPRMRPLTPLPWHRHRVRPRAARLAALRAPHPALRRRPSRLLLRLQRRVRAHDGAGGQVGVRPLLRASASEPPTAGASKEPQHSLSAERSERCRRPPPSLAAPLPLPLLY